MSPMQWAFEFYSIRKKEKEERDFNFLNLKGLLVSLLGLNALRPEHPNKIPKSYDEMTQEEKDAFLPLIAWCARPDMLKPVVEQIQAEFAIAQASENQSYEDMVAAIDAAGGDMEPMFGPINPEVGKGLNKTIKQYPSDNKGSESNIEADVEDV